MGIPANLLYFLIAYTAAILLVTLMNKREFHQSPEKGQRYKALPLVYKLACWFVVVPLFAGIVVHGGFGVLAIVSFFLLESACVRWYQNAGLLG